MKKLNALFILLPFFLLAQNQVLSDTKLGSPRATIFTHLNSLNPDSYNPKLAAKTIYGIKGKEAEDIAIKIKKIFDGRGLKVDFDKIPSTNNYIDSISNKGKHHYVLFPFQLSEIYVVKIGDKWYYSPESIKMVNTLYKKVYPWYTDKLQQIIPEIGHYKFLNIELWQLIGIFALLLFCWVLFYFFNWIVYHLLRRVQYWIIHRRDDQINSSLKKLARPIVFLLLSAVVKLLLPSLFLSLDVNNVLFLGLNIMTTVFWIYVFLKLVKVFISIYSGYAERTESKLDDQLIPVLNNLLSGIVIFLGFLKLLTLFGVQPVTVIAGASIGGLALALASQDTVKNLIGTLMIFLDKPFHIGDWIEAGTVIGTVEKVGFRSTRVRAADTSIYQIPNSSLAEMVVNNKGLRSFRRYQTNLGIRYDTPPELIDAFVKGIRNIIAKHDGTRNDAYNVEFVGFGDSQLLILLNVYFVNLDWNKEQEDRHTLHMEILKFSKLLGVNFAFPSTTMHIENFPEKSGVKMNYDIDQNRIQKIIDASK